MEKNIMVSVICNAYNHEKYIKSALDGFVMQKTNFPFEVLVHDDASTDGTADIIREYEAKYPDIIKPIYQSENQYSQKIPISKTFQYPRAKGKYIAFCEGDDYWTDPLKLQKQFDLMESHPECDMCAHTAQYEKNGELAEYVMPSETDTILTIDEVICNGGGYLATASHFFKKKLIENPPKFREILSLDYTLQIQGALSGGILYIADCMSVYRYETANSWTAKMKGNNREYVVLWRKIIRMLEQLDMETNYKHNSAITKTLNRHKKEMLYTMYCHHIEPNEEDLVWIKKYPISKKAALRLRYAMHRVKQSLKSITRK